MTQDSGNSPSSTSSEFSSISMQKRKRYKIIPNESSLGALSNVMASQKESQLLESPLKSSTNLCEDDVASTQELPSDRKELLQFVSII